MSSAWSKVLRIIVPIGTRPEAAKSVSTVAHLKALGHNVKVFQSRQYEAFSDGSADVANYPRGLISAAQKVKHDIREQIAASKADIVISIGDTTTAFASALAAQEAQRTLVHVEAGMRTSRLDVAFPEEFFRRWIDDLADVLICSHHHDRKNLHREGHTNKLVTVIPNPIYDTIDYPEVVIQDRILVHIHRRETSEEAYESLLTHLDRFARERACSVIAIANRRFDSIDQSNSRWKGIAFTSPLDRIDFLKLLASSQILISDSGTLQEECYAMQIPHVIFREHTERPYLVDNFRSLLSGADPKTAIQTLCLMKVLFAKDLGTLRPRPRAAPGGGKQISTFIDQLSCDGSLPPRS